MSKPYDIDLDERVKYLEQANLFKMMALDLSRELGEFNSSISRLEDPGEILEICQERARKLIRFKQLSFFLVSEEDSGFYPYRWYPDDNTDALAREVEILIEDGTFSRAVMEKAPVTAFSEGLDCQILLHVLSTASRVRGMFIGILEEKSKYIKEAAFELLSILMAHCANALESFELYSQLHASNLRLQEKVNALCRSEDSLKKEIIEHRKTGAALEASEERYRLLAEAAREMILLVSPGHQIKYANASAKQICGHENSTLAGLPVTDFFHEFESLTLSSATKSNFLVVQLDAPGGPIPMEINIVEMSKGDQTSGYLVIGRDISERLADEKERKDLEAKLWQAQKMESIGLLASGIAHDFNNMLTVISNFNELAMSRVTKQDPIYDDLENVDKASDRAISLARKLHTIGRRDDHQTGAVDICTTISETVGLLKSAIQKEITVQCDMGNGPLVIRAEETRIQQIIMNLVTNAAQAMETGKGRIEVNAGETVVESVRTLAILDLEPGKYVKITVRDDGPGVSKKTLQRMFEPYFSTKAGENNSGLGLAVVHGIVKNYMGGIDVRTEQGQGTCFDIYLPKS